AREVLVRNQRQNVDTHLPYSTTARDIVTSFKPLKWSVLRSLHSSTCTLVSPTNLSWIQNCSDCDKGEA
ncbi:Protein of unknown function D, partial [Prunus dulcis]